MIYPEPVSSASCTGSHVTSEPVIFFSLRPWASPKIQIIVK